MKIYIQLITVFLLSILFGAQVHAQQVDFELRYNEATSIYEVYATPDSSNSFYFVGGGSQVTLVLPQDLDDAPLQINTVAGGVWLDNSRILKPASDHIHDFHGIASNGSVVNFVKGEALLLFTFELPDGACRSDIRLFENTLDPGSAANGMNRADFRNFFANVFEPFKNNWERNDNLINPECAHAPAVASQVLTIEQDSRKTICMPIVDPNIGDSFQVQLCNNATANGNGASILSVTGNELCLTYSPSAGYVGPDEVCIQVCDQTGLCNNAMIAVEVVPDVIHATIDGFSEDCDNIVDWTIYNPSDFIHYELQRSKDGQNFELLEQFEATSQSANQLSQYKDKGVRRDYSYRLKLVLTDERVKYSEVVFIKYECDVKNEIVTSHSMITGHAKNCENVIDWTIYNPSNFSHYELQRSRDGQSFTMLDQFESRNEIDKKEHQFLDKEVENDQNYRLKLVFVDGSIKYSEVVFVESECKEEHELAVYPNPLGIHEGTLNIKFYSEDQEVELVIIDIVGHFVRRVKLSVELGWNLVRLDVTGLPVGTYVMKNMNSLEVAPFIIQE